jgi:hypothetical protein
MLEPGSEEALVRVERGVEILDDHAQMMDTARLHGFRLYREAGG